MKDFSDYFLDHFLDLVIRFYLLNSKEKDKYLNGINMGYLKEHITIIKKL